MPGLLIFAVRWRCSGVTEEFSLINDPENARLTPCVMALWGGSAFGFVSGAIRRPHRPVAVGRQCALECVNRRLWVGKGALGKARSPR